MKFRHFSREQGRVFRDSDAAFNTASYAQGWEPHIPPSLWNRIVLFFKRNFA
jgi:hypothetical protein